jgi:biotin carboxyl carrier protein
MRYFVTVGERTFEIDVDGEQVSVDGVAVGVELLEVFGTPLRRLSLDGESHRVVADRGEARGEWDLHVDGYRIAAEVVDERTRAIRAMTARTDAPKGPKPVKAPMPGMIMRIDVSAGDQVRAGQGVLIIEAMKMENELKAEAAGTVSKINVSPGTAVEKGTVLIEFAVDG